MKVFISSPYSGLESERQAVRDRIEPDYVAEGMEDFGSTGLPPLETCLEALAECDACILILAGRYGSLVPQMEISYTEAEYEYSQRHGIRVFAYVVDEFDAAVDSAAQSDDARRKQRELKRFVESEVTVEQDYYSTEADLADKAKRDLDRWRPRRKRPRFKRSRTPIRHDAAYAAGRMSKSLGTLYPYPVVLIDVANSHLPKYPSAAGGRIPTKVHEIYHTLEKQGASVTIFNDLPVYDLTKGTHRDQRIAMVKATEALVVCFVRREDDVADLAAFESLGRERALWISESLVYDDELSASYVSHFSGKELNECGVALQVTDFLKRKLDEHILASVAASHA